MVKTHSNTRTCTGRHPMADSSLTDPARTTHPGQLWTNAYVLTQCTASAANLMRWVRLQPLARAFDAHRVRLCTIHRVWKANRLYICTSVVRRVQHREGTSGLLCRSYADHPSDFYPKAPRQEQRRPQTSLDCFFKLAMLLSLRCHAQCEQIKLY